MSILWSWDQRGFCLHFHMLRPVLYTTHLKDSVILWVQGGMPESLCLRKLQVARVGGLEVSRAVPVKHELNPRSQNGPQFSFRFTSSCIGLKLGNQRRCNKSQHRFYSAVKSKCDLHSLHRGRKHLARQKPGTSWLPASASTPNSWTLKLSNPRAARP